MSYRPYAPPAPLLIGYDPVRDLPPDHLARLVEQAVEEALPVPRRPRGRGQPPFDPRLPINVLVYGYATGTRSSRQLARLCDESLPYLFLTRGDTPSYKTLCTVRVEQTEGIEAVWIGLFTVAQELKLERLGHLVVDSTKLRANASPEAVVTPDEYEPLRQELTRILEEARQVDEREAAEGHPGTTRLGVVAKPEQMREILRRVRTRRAQEKQRAKAAAARAERARAARAAAPTDGPAAGTTPPPAAEGAAVAPAPADAPTEEPPRGPLGPRMIRRLQAGVAALEAAAAEGRKHLCLTDPEARMMGEGREKKIRECYSFEVAVDREAGLLVVGQISQEPSDNTRLERLVAAAQPHEPAGVKAVDGDSGYYSGGAIGRLLAAGLDLCVPDSQTAGDLHRGQPIGTVRASTRGRVEFEYDAAADCYRCPEGNRLCRVQTRVDSGQQITEYRAQRECRGCPLAGECLTQAKAQYRTLKISQYQAELEADRQRFADPAHQERYRHRGEVVETVFGFVRGTLGYARFLLRGKERVGCEARLIKTAYQLRKLQAQRANG
jgi:transposase